MAGETFRLLNVVALTDDMPERDLVRGQVGTIVETLAEGVFEAEFCDEEGRSYDMFLLGAFQLMRLVYEGIEAA